MLTEGIRFSTDFPDEDKAVIVEQIMRDNRKFVITWACAESVYWIFDLIMAKYKRDFYLCRNAYAGALIVCLAALLMTLLFTRKNLKLVPLAAVMTEVALLGAGAHPYPRKSELYGRYEQARRIKAAKVFQGAQP